jgi:hypothetical protein
MTLRTLAGQLLPAAALAAAVGLSACDDAGADEHQLAPSRVYEPVGRTIHWDASAAERHGISAKDFAPTMAGASTTAGPTAEAETADEARLRWSTPAGWVELPPATFRDANFLVAGDERAECYLTTIGGEAGGLDANINRWRSQLSLPPLDEAAIAALPRVPWLGGDAILVDFEGHWTGMMGDEAGEDWRLVGLLQIRHDQSRFLKMVGPAEVVGPQVGTFRARADSFRVGAGEGDAAPAEAAPAATAGATGGAERTDALAWRTPAGWMRTPDKPMREVTYVAGEGGRVECSVTLLGGTGGGVLANINRWCGQLGAPPLTETDLAALEAVQVAGGEGVLVRLERGPGATAEPVQELLLGAVALLPERAVFVKMTGPRDAVEGQRAALIGFCASLEILP